MLRKLVKECNTIYQVYKQQNLLAMNQVDGRNIQNILSKLDDTKITKFLLNLIKDRPKSSIYYVNAQSCPKNTYSIGIFILNGRSVLPFHDHPLMVVASKVLCGTGQIETFTLQSNPQIQLSYPHLNHFFSDQNSQLVQVKDHKIDQIQQGQILWTFPIDSNIHSFSNKNLEPFAFIDVLVPQYDFKERFCNFYQRKSIDNEELLLTSNPQNYPDIEIINIHLDLDEFFV